MYFTEMRLRVVRRRIRTADCRQLQTCLSLSLSLSLSATATLACLAWGPPLSLRHYITVTLQDRLSHLSYTDLHSFHSARVWAWLGVWVLFSPCLDPGSVGSEKSVQSVQCGPAGSSGLPHRGLTQDLQHKPGDIIKLYSTFIPPQSSSHQPDLPLATNY